MRRLSALVALLVAALVVGLLGPPAAARVAPRDPGTFNVIAPWGPPPARWRIVTGVEKAIGNVPARRKNHPRPRIYIATYMLDRKRTVDRLIAACRRGVSVRVILDDDVESRPSRRLRGVLNADNVRDRNKNGRADKKADRGPCDTKLRKDKKKDKKKHKNKDKKKRDSAGKKGKQKAGKKQAKKRHARKERRPRPLPLPKKWGRDRSYVKTCDGACRGPGWNMHSKFYVFSRTGPYRHVVKMSSSNLNAGGALRGWNDMYTIRNRAKLYRTFAHVHRTMTVEKAKRPRLIQVKSGPYTVRFYPVRYAGPRIDPVGRDLDKIHCRPGKKRHYRTKVFVSMFYWRGSRGERLARKLLELGRHGCRVKVVIGAPSRKIAGQLRRASRKRVITAYDSRWDLDMDGLVEKRTHAKFVLVKGGYGHRRRSYQVMTGSGNWVRGSLAGGDEVSLNIRGKRPYRQYVRAWDRIRDHSRVMGRW